MGEDEHRIIVEDVLSQMILLEYLAIWDWPYYVRALCIHEIYCEVFCPFMLFKEFPV